jgi:hypothetical protein
MSEPGSLVVLTLTVDGADTDTEVSALAYSPVEGADPVALLALPAALPSRAAWTANLTPASAGDWLVKWTVTGSGAGTTWDTVPVGPAPLPPPPGRVYATTGQLADYTGEDPPADARKLLRRASRKVDQLLITAHYAVDEDGMPTDADVAAAMAEATCAQVEWWGETGDTAGTGAVAALAGSQIGTVKLAGGNSAAGGGSGSIEYAPDAVAALRLAGLTNQGPHIPGPHSIPIRGRL